MPPAGNVGSIPDIKTALGIRTRLLGIAGVVAEKKARPQGKTLDPEIFNLVNPIVAVRAVGGGVLVVQRKSKLKTQPALRYGRKEKKMTRFTAKSMSALIATINSTDVEFHSFLTLTYPGLFPLDGRAVKKDLNRFLNLFRRVYKSEYVWFLEFQERGAPHLHAMLEYDTITPRMRIRITENWVSGIARAEWFERQCQTPMGKPDDESMQYDFMRLHLSRAYKFTMRPQTVELIRKKDGAKRYVTAYAAKEYQKTPPEKFEGVGRFWGCSKGVQIPKVVGQPRTEQRLRLVLKAQEHATADWEILPKYLFAVSYAD